MNTIPAEEQLADAIEEAAEKAVKDLFAQHPGHYYYPPYLESAFGIDPRICSLRRT